MQEMRNRPHHPAGGGEIPKAHHGQSGKGDQAAVGERTFPSKRQVSWVYVVSDGSTSRTACACAAIVRHLQALDRMVRRAVADIVA